MSDPTFPPHGSAPPPGGPPSRSTPLGPSSPFDVSAPSPFGAPGVGAPPPPPGAPPGYGQLPVGQPQWAHPPRPTGTNGLAVAGFVLGLLWVCGIGSVLGVVFGFVALSQIRRRNQSGRGLAIAGIVLGIIGIVATVAGGILIAVKGDDIINSPGEVDDVEITACRARSTEGAEATLEIVNNSSRMSDYVITVRFEAGDESAERQVDITNVSSDPDGQGPPREVTITTGDRLGDADLRCELAFVDRRVSSGRND